MSTYEERAEIAFKDAEHFKQPYALVRVVDLRNLLLNLAELRRRVRVAEEKNLKLKKV